MTTHTPALLSPQAKKLLGLLRSGRAVTRLIAMHYGIMNVTARLTELRAFGFAVACKMKHDLNGNRYGEWSLAHDPHARRAAH